MEREAEQRGVLIADDHALVREGFRAMLEGELDIEVVGEAKNGQEALEQCLKLHPDLVLMDVRMPGMDGLEATRAIKEVLPRTGVLVVTAHEGQEYLLEAIKAGAAGYVLKEASKRQLLGAVRGVLRGESPLNQDLVMGLLRRLANEAPKRDAAGLGAAPPVPPGRPTTGQERPESSLLGSLTPREVEVLKLVAQRQTNQQIAQNLSVSVSTVKHHVHHIISKLEVSDRIHAATLAIDHGLVAIGVIELIELWQVVDVL